MASGAAAWSVKGIDEKTRNVAREAAAAAGLTIGEWIDQTIRLEATTTDGVDPEGGVDGAATGLDDRGDAGSTDGVPTDPTSVELLDFLDTELERSRKRIDRSLVPIGRVLHDLAVSIVETEGRRPRGTIERTRFAPAADPAAEPTAEPSTVNSEQDTAARAVGDGPHGVVAGNAPGDPPPETPKEAQVEARVEARGGGLSDAGADAGDGWDDPIWSDPTVADGSGGAASRGPDVVVTASAELDVAFRDEPETMREEADPGGTVTSEPEPSAAPPLRPPSAQHSPEPMAAMPRSRAMADYVADAPDPRADLSERPAVADFEEPDPSDYPDLAPEPEGDFSPAITPLDMDGDLSGGDPAGGDLADEGRVADQHPDESRRQPGPGSGSRNGTWQARVDDWDAAPDPSGDFDSRVRLDEAMDPADAAKSRAARQVAGEASPAARSHPSAAPSSSLEDRLDALRRAAARDDPGPVDGDPHDDLPITPTYATGSAPLLSVDESGPAIRITGHQARFESHPGRAVTERNQARRQRMITWTRRAATAMAAAVVLAVVGAWFAADRLGLQAEKTAVSSFLETKRAEVRATLEDARKSLSDGGLVLLAPGPGTRAPTSEPNPMASVEIPTPTDRVPETESRAPESRAPALVPPIPPTIPPSQQGVAPSGLASMDSGGSRATPSSAETTAAAPPSAAASTSGSPASTTPAKPSSETHASEKPETAGMAAERSASGASAPASPGSGSSPSAGSNATPPTETSREPVATVAPDAAPPPAPILPSVDVARLPPPSGAGTADQAPGSPGPGPLHLAWLQDQARRGDPRAQHDLALLHYDGAGVARDPIKAADWFREAAIQGDANAQYNLGVLYEKGLGVRQDDVRALLWYHSAAEQSHPVAQLNLGTLYAEGRGIPLSYEEARRWFQAAAENGVAAGYYNLGVLAEMGLGGRPDEPAALDLYRLAAEMGHSGAAARLAHEAADPDAVKPSDMQLAKTLGLERTERLDIPVVVEIQARLGRLGVYSGRIDGVAGPRTREAIRDYEAAKGLPVTGSPSDALLRHLREATDPIAGTPPVTG